MNIEISLDVFKALTSRMAYDGQSYSDIIQELLDEEAIVEPDDLSQSGQGPLHEIHLRQAQEGGYAFRKLFLPHGTELRAVHKRKEYRARIDNNVWIDEAGAQHPSPSAAATAITGNSVNGLRFWHARRPQDRSWRRLDALSIE